MATEIKTTILEQLKLCKTSRWAVVLLNDDFTSMDFVVRILMEIFDKNNEDAINLMLKVHNEGRGVAGIYSYEVARAKKDLTHRRASSEGYPLRALLEER